MCRSPKSSGTQWLVNLIEVIASEGSPFYAYIILDHYHQLVYWPPVRQEGTDFIIREAATLLGNSYLRNNNRIGSAFKYKLFGFEL